jgi:hypothetical protein
MTSSWRVHAQTLSYYEQHKDDRDYVPFMPLAPLVRLAGPGAEFWASYVVIPHGNRECDSPYVAFAKAIGM